MLVFILQVLSNQSYDFPVMKFHTQKSMKFYIDVIVLLPVEKYMHLIFINPDVDLNHCCTCRYKPIFAHQKSKNSCYEKIITYFRITFTNKIIRAGPRSKRDI